MPSSLPRALASPISRRAALRGLSAAAMLAAIAPGGAGAARKPAPDPVRAIYMNPEITTDRAGFDRLVALIERTELNALVLDIKEAAVHYDTGVAFFRDAGAVVPRYDAPELISALHRRGIRAIARLVCFKDPATVVARPDLAIRDQFTGEPWRDGGGETWLNPFSEEVWDATVDLAAEAAKIGFDEIQFDYVRLPDGDLSGADFGPITYDYDARTGAIAGFLGLAQQRLVPLSVDQSADIFGYTLLVDDDLGIGQDADVLAPLVDVLCPMVYPSHFPEGSIAVPGHPNDFPGETIRISMDSGAAKFGDARQLRPWLQAFSLPWLREYTAADVRAQIDAADVAGTGGWMLWDPTNLYQEEALAPA